MVRSRWWTPSSGQRQGIYDVAGRNPVEIQGQLFGDTSRKAEAWLATKGA